MTSVNNTLLGIPIENQTTENILEKIKKYLQSPSGFYHIVSLNPEILMLTQQDKVFKKVVETAQIRIVDGVGIVLAGQILGFKATKTTGVDLMEKIINLAYQMKLKVGLIGGKKDLAIRLAECYGQNNSEAKFFGIESFENIHLASEQDQKKVITSITALKPHILFVAFGSPEQELWIYKNRASLQGIVCMGVGGAFDFLSGEIKRAPRVIQAMGLEWLYRLIRQPWRWKRQLRLMSFVIAVLREKFRG